MARGRVASEEDRLEAGMECAEFSMSIRSGRGTHFHLPSPSSARSPHLLPTSPWSPHVLPSSPSIRPTMFPTSPSLRSPNTTPIRSASNENSKKSCVDTMSSWWEHRNSADNNQESPPSSTSERSNSHRPSSYSGSPFFRSRRPSAPSKMSSKAAKQTGNDKNMHRFVNNMQEQFLRATMLAAGSIDKQLGEVFFAQSPIAAALSKLQIRVFLIAWMIVLWVDVYFGIHEWEVSVEHPPALRNVSRLKLVPIELRNGQREGITQTGLFGMGVSRAGSLCSELGEHFTDGPEATVEFPEPVNGHSLLFKTGEGDPALDVVRFQVLSQVEGREWVQAAMSGWIHDWDARLILYPGKYHMPTERRQEAELYTGVSLGWLLGYTGSSIITASGFLVVVVLASVEREALAARGFVCMLAANTAVLLLAAAFVHHPLHFCYFLVQGLCLLLLTAGLIVRERHLLRYIAIIGCYYLGWALYEFFFSSPKLISSAVFHCTIGAGLTVLALTVLWLRRRTVQQAYALVAPDKDMYDGLWRELCADPTCAQSLQRLRAVEARIDNQIRVDDAYPLQLNRRRSPADGEVDPIAVCSALDVGIPGTVAPGDPVRSLDQLYAQAAGIRPILLAKVQTWCAASAGKVPCAAHSLATTREERGERDSDSPFDANPTEAAQDWQRAPAAQIKFVRWSEVAGEGPAGQGQVLWAKNKSLARAIEKTVRAYRGDPSLLLDLCRQSIVFDKVDELASCLDFIAADPEVVVTRIKNRLRDDYDSTLSAGYRDCAVNLRIINEATCGLGVDTHVCELQLILMPFARMKGDAGHARYVAFRNARGE